MSGGTGLKFKTFNKNKNNIKTYSNRASLAENLSKEIHIRATGVGWCTADTTSCAGGFGLESTRCSDCSYSVIEKKQADIWQAIYDQQKELLDLNDIGLGAKDRIRRDINRCHKVLDDLGFDIK